MCNNIIIISFKYFDQCNTLPQQSQTAASASFKSVQTGQALLPAISVGISATSALTNSPTFPDPLIGLVAISLCSAYSAIDSSIWVGFKSIITPFLLCSLIPSPAFEAPVLLPEGATWSLPGLSDWEEYWPISKSFSVWDFQEMLIYSFSISDYSPGGVDAVFLLRVIRWLVKPDLMKSLMPLFGQTRLMSSSGCWGVKISFTLTDCACLLLTEIL